MSDLEIGAFEAKNRLSHLLALVERGQQVYLTRRGRRVALLVRPGAQGLTACDGPPPPAELLESFRKLRAAAQPGPESIWKLVEEGRS